MRPGDTLWEIAQKYNTTVEDIAGANGITFVDEIYPGQQLRIYVKDAAAVPPSEGPVVFQWYLVRPGDSLHTIAKRFGLDHQELIALNHLPDPNLIYPGQLIRIR